MSYNTAEPKPFIAEDMSSAALAPAFTEGPEVVEECTSLEEWEVEGTPEIVTKVPMPLARQATTNLLDVTLRRRR